MRPRGSSSKYLLLTEPAAVGAWFWRWRSRSMWSVAPDKLQPASDWSPGPGWFRHNQHNLGQTGVGVGEPILGLLRCDDPSQLCHQVSGVPSQQDTRAGLVPVGFPVTVEPETWALRPVGLSLAEQISDSLCLWGLRGLDATTPVATRTSHSLEQIIGFCNPASRRCS